MNRAAEEHLLRRRRRPVDLRLARRGGRQHPALRARFSRREDHPPGAQLPQHRAHPRRRLASDCPQRGPARQDAAHRGRAGREGRRSPRPGTPRKKPAPSARRSSSFSAATTDDESGRAPRPAPAQRDRHPGARLVPDARVRGPLRHPRPALSGDRRAALLRAPGNPRRAGLSARGAFARQRPRLRAHRQRAQARARRRHRAASARPRPQAPHPAHRSRARHGRDRRAQAEGAQLAAHLARQLRPLARAEGRAAAHRAGRDHPRRVRLHRDVAEGPLRRRRRPARQPQGADPLHGRVREPRRLPRAHLAGDGPRQGREPRRGLDHDLALRQGAGVRHRVPARLGGRRVPEPARARRPGPRRARGGAASCARRA